MKSKIWYQTNVFQRTQDKSGTIATTREIKKDNILLNLSEATVGYSCTNMSLRFFPIK